MNIKFVHTKSCKIFVQNREIKLLLAYILSIHDNKSYKIDQVDRLDMFWGVTKMTVVIPCYGITSFQAPLKPHRRGKSRQLRFHEFVHQHGVCNDMMKT